ncbi:MAG: biosynthetic-type acetolactate synthase large subunit [Spirochaetes bacterium]|nr:biosynthetic-type acetolactate synthase large subunit [Spirochaetota bacterium]
MKGANILIESLRKEGVKHIFGYPGGVLIPTFDVLYDTKDIELILTRHEQGAAHAADGYARASGKVGVCIATSGPGATNLITGIATAYMDSIPIVFITGQVPTSLIGNDAFQEADIVGITRPITKHNYLVKDVKDLARIIKEAFHIASTGRPGPVLIDIPKDVTTSEAEFVYPEKAEIRSYNPTTEGNPKQIKKAAEMINAAKRPVIYAGGGVIISEANEELKKFTEKTGIQVTMTLLGLGALKSDHPLSLGMLGMHGTVYANKAISGSDLIISIGARFDDRVTGKLDEFAPHAKIIHIDIDPTSVSKNVGVDIPIVGDAKNVLKLLTAQIKKPSIDDWNKKIETWKKESPLSYEKDSKTIKPQFVIEKLSELTNGEAIIATEVGQHQMWAAQFYNFKNPRTMLTSGGLGTMGYGLPAALGAKFALPDKLVVDIAGDGSIQMNIQELATAVMNKKPVKIIILNNGCLGMVRQWQELFYDKRYASTILSNFDTDPVTAKNDMDYIPDFVKLAEAYGAYGRRITDPAEVEDALKDMIKRDETCIMEFIISPEENVFPMVPAGAGLTQMIGGMA